MVPVCLTCGEIGFEEALIYLFKCKDCAQHRYCLDGPVIFGDPVIWFCKDCEAEVLGIDHHDSEMADSEEVEMDSGEDCVIVAKPQPTVDSIWRMKEYFTLILHHGGVLERDDNRRLKYIGGETCVWDKIESDDINMFAVESLVKHCKGYHIIAKLSYMKPYIGVKSDLNICLYPLTTDNHVMDMVKVARANGNEVEIFVEHPIEEREELERDIEVAATQKKTKKPELERSTEIDLLSAEERAVIDKFLANILDTHLNFGATEEHIETTATQITEDVADQPTKATQDTQIGESRKGKEKVTQAPKRKRSLRRNNRIGITINEEAPMNFDSSSEDSDLEEDFEIEYRAGQKETMFEVGDSSHENIPRSANIEVDRDENNETYHSEELSNPIGNDDENDGSANIVDLKLGMEFSTLQMFKSAVKDFTIYYGSDIKWVRSEKIRASAICKKEECDWRIYCSWNDKKKCFQVKTYVPNHTCSKLSANKQANRKRHSGRHKKRRRDGDEEPVNGHNMKKSYNEPKCLKCGLLGHNTRGCAKQSVARRLRNWVPPKLQHPQGEYHVAQQDKIVVEEGQMNEEYEEQQVRKNMIVAEEMVQEQPVIAGNTVEHILDHAKAHAKPVLPVRKNDTREPIISTKSSKYLTMRRVYSTTGHNVKISTKEAVKNDHVRVIRGYLLDM